MKEEKIKKLEKISQKLISEYFTTELKEIEEDFGLINITNLKISSDLSYLDVYVSAFKNNDILCKELAKYAWEITKKINKNIKIYKIPKIRFRYDYSGQIGSSTIKAINDL